MFTQRDIDNAVAKEVAVREEELTELKKKSYFGCEYNLILFNLTSCCFSFLNLMSSCYVCLGLMHFLYKDMCKDMCDCSLQFRDVMRSFSDYKTE